MISFDAGASRFIGRNRVRSGSNVNFFATLRWIHAHRWSEGRQTILRSCLCVIWLRAGDISLARGPGSVDGRAAASADTSHYSWPSFKIKVSIARTEPCLASLWLPTPTP